MSTPLDVIEGRAQWCVVEGEALAQLQALPTGSIGALITDPPYSSGGFTRGDRTVEAGAKYSRAETSIQVNFGGDNRDQRGFEFWCALWLSEAQRAASLGAPIVQFSDWRQLPLTTDAIQAGGWVWRGIWVWDKGEGSRPTMGRFRASSEFAVWGTNGPSLDLVSVGCLQGSLRSNTVPTADRVHLTEKPVEVMEAVCGIAPPGSVVLDPFCGSGTTGVAAVRLGRRFIGIERDSHYAAIARERIAAEVNGLSLRDVRHGQRGLFEVAP